MTEHMRAGKGVQSPNGEHLWLDIRHLGDKHLSTKLREVDDICKHFLGIDCRHQLIPVRPTQHYTMSGIRTDKNGAAYGLTGLFSAGEAACWDMHGFNRLGGNSLAETVVAGGIIGKKIVEFLKGYETSFSTAAAHDAVKKQEERIKDLISCKNGKENVYEVRDVLQNALMQDCFVFRNEEGLKHCIGVLQEALARARKVGLASSGIGVNFELASALKLEGQIKLGLMIAKAALERRESRGSHNREDYPARDDAQWLNRTLAIWKPGADLPELSYEDASQVFEIPPGERGYGGGKIIPADPTMVAARTIKKNA